MQVSLVTYHRLAKFVGTILSLMGIALASVFAMFLFTGNSPIAGGPVNFDGPSLLVLASIGAFTLPLGLSLFSRDEATSARLRIAGYALGLMALLRLVAFSSPQMRAAVGVAPLVEFFILGGIAMVAFWVRPDTEAPVNCRLELELEVPAERAWTVLAEQFGDVGEYASGVRKSTMDDEVGTGAVRTCQTQGFGPFPSLEITETLTEFDREVMTYAYVAGGELPKMIPSSTNRWTIEPIGANRCRVRSHARIQLKWWALPLAPLLDRSIHSEIERFGEELRHKLETGTPHPRKVAAAQG